MNELIREIDKEQIRENPLADFNPGDSVRVHERIKEGTRERIQIFEGTVIKRQHGGVKETFTVRKLAYGVGVEKTFPVNAPSVELVEVKRKGQVRRARLFYLRDRIGKATKVREGRTNK